MILGAVKAVLTGHVLLADAKTAYDFGISLRMVHGEACRLQPLAAVRIGLLA